jgi:hypothetical protein
MKIWFDTEFIEDGRTIELISIGMVREDGATYYAETDQYRPGKASQWVKDNVLVHLKGGVAIKPLDVIGREIIDFAGDDPEFWAYYADYDWVALCQLFGTMMQLPSGWPMFCRDVKQLCVSLGDPELPSQTSVEHHALNDAKWTKTAWEFLQSYPQCVASAETTASSADPLLPCPFCSMPMTLQGDYTEETAWNFYCHADRDAPEVSMCPMKDHQINTMRDMWTPDHNEATAWNTRAALRSPAVGGKKLHKSMWQQPEYDPELSLLGAVKEMAASQDGPEYQSQPETATMPEIVSVLDANWPEGHRTAAEALLSKFNVTRKTTEEPRG